MWPKPVANLINKHYNIISCVRLNNYKFVFIFVYFKQKGMTSTKINVLLLFLMVNINNFFIL